MPRGPTASSLDALWNFSDPAASERRFRRFLRDLKRASNPGLAAEALTQVARAEALQRKFRAAHRTLDSLAPRLSRLAPRARTRYLLERGRTFNSGGAPRKALPLFLAAWKGALAHGDDALAIDAAHMAALVASGARQRSWNEKALKIAEGSRSRRARRWRASLHNNIGWSDVEAGDYRSALRNFQRAVRLRQRQGDASETRIARWCVAKALRLLGRVPEALRVQRRLLAAWRRARRKDGYVFEELGECLLALHQPREARPFFRAAYAELSRDAWVQANEPNRVKRLRRLGEGLPSG